MRVIYYTIPLRQGNVNIANVVRDVQRMSYAWCEVVESNIQSVKVMLCVATTKEYRGVPSYAEGYLENALVLETKNVIKNM